MNARIFIRNDDGCRLDEPFRYFFDAAKDFSLPVVHAVIPGKLESDFIRFLNRAKEKTPHLLDIVQHGWVHANHSNTIKKYEFGSSRSLQAQRQDIRKGLERMTAAFGGNFTPAFVPPFHGFNVWTEQIVKEEQFRIFSAGIRKLKNKGELIELRAMISMSFYGGIKSVLWPADNVIKMLVKNAWRYPLAGLVTHHADFKTVASRKKLQRLFHLIAALMNKKEWKVMLFSDLITHENTRTL